MPTPIIALLERAIRVVRSTESENVSLKAEREILQRDNAALRQRTEQLERERGELVEQFIDLLEQGEEIVRAGAAKGGPRPEAPAAPRSAYKGILGEIADNLGSARERMTTADFARTFGGNEESPPGQDVTGKV